MTDRDLTKAQIKHLICVAFNAPREVLSHADLERLIRRGYLAEDETITGKGRALVHLIAARQLSRPEPRP